MMEKKEREGENVRERGERERMRIFREMQDYYSNDVYFTNLVDSELSCVKVL